MLMQRLGLSEVIVAGTETTAHVEVTATLLGILRMSGKQALIDHADALERSMGLIVFGVSEVRHGNRDLGTYPNAKLGMDGPIDFYRGEVYARKFGGRIPYLGDIATFTRNQHKLASAPTAEVEA